MIHDDTGDEYIDEFNKQQLHINHLLNDIDDLIFEQNRDTPVVFNYEGTNLMQLDSPNIDSPCIKTVRLFIYNVNKSAVVPFLEFLLHKGSFKFNLSFIEYTFNSETYDIKCKEILQRIMQTFSIKTEPVYKGWEIFDECILCMFYEIQFPNHSSQLMLKTNDLWFVLLDEILNHPTVVNCYSISNDVRNMFYDNIEFGILSDIEESCFESPTVLYAGFRKQRLEFYGTFGNPPLSLTESKCNCNYLFKSFENASDDAYNVANRYGDNNAGGIVRFAVFLGKQLYEKDNEYNENQEESNSHDSFTGLTANKDPFFYVKEYHQQCSLTYHYLDIDGNIV
jgi:hypothetical protein